MTYRFPELANKIATVIAIILVVIAMDGRWFIGTPARAEPIVSPSPYPPRKSKSEPDASSPGPAEPNRTANVSGTARSAGAARPSSTSGASGTAHPSSASGISNPTAAPGSGLGDDVGCAARGGKRALTGTLDLNTATVDQLTMLPGIGPAKAERIVSWRRKHGPFRRTADLRRVSGFGFKTFKRLEAYLAITGPTTLVGG